MITLTKTTTNPAKNLRNGYTINNALIALKLSRVDDAILNYLKFFSGQIPIKGAHFLHVLPPFDLFNALYERESQSIMSNFELNKDAIEQMKNETRGRIELVNTPHIEFEVREGDPLAELLTEANEIKPDLTIIGQQDSTSFHGILARNLARKINTNALIIPEKAKPRLKRLLVPIDFSTYSIKALQIAVAIQKQLEEPAEIVCLNVYEMPNLSVYRIQRTMEQFKDMVEKDRQEAFQNFTNTYAPDAPGLIDTVLIEKAYPGTARYLLDYAMENEIDMILMGAKGHSKVERLLIGSVTEKLLTLNNQIPTLIIR